jgi:MoaA/NifB/PqqE/SkfB family radical SAM enzyme
VSDKICAFPWHMYSIDTGFGWWRSCPRADYKPLNDLNFFNHDELIKQRQELRNNIAHDDCWRCWDAEKDNSKSYRQVLAMDYPHKYVEQNNIQVPELLEIKFSNLCNLKCIMCSSNCSSLWEKDQPIDPSRLGKYRGPQVAQKILEFADTHYKDIKMFQLFGGEPVLHKEFDDVFNLILSKPISDGQKTVSFSTNMYYNETYRKQFEDKIEAVLDNGHKLFMRFSIDGMHEQGEYVRTNMEWNKFEDNLDSFMERFHDRPELGRMRCNIALNITNLVYLDKIMQFIANKGYTNVTPHYNYVHKPEYFYIKSYGTRLQRALELIEKQDYAGYDTYKTHVIDLVKSMSHLEPNYAEIQNAKTWLDKYDKQVNKDFLNLFPLNEYMFND